MKKKKPKKNISKANKLAQKVSNDISNEEEFKPTPHMIVWLDTQIRTGTDVVAEIERQSNIPQQNWYRWIKDPQFEDWYWAEYDRKTRRWKPTVDAIGLKYAKRGSDKHFEYLARRVGNIKEDKNTNVAVQVNTVIQEKKSKYGL